MVEGVGSVYTVLPGSVWMGPVLFDLLQTRIGLLFKRSDLEMYTVFTCLDILNTCITCSYKDNILEAVHCVWISSQTDTKLLVI